MQAVPKSLSTIGLIESISEIVVTLDGNGVVQFINASVERILGYRPDEIVGQRFLEFVTAGYSTAAKYHLREAQAAEGKYYDSELWFRHKNGGECLIKSRSVNRLGDPDLSCLILTCRDITEERRQQIAYTAAMKKLGLGLRDIIITVGTTVGARDPYTASHQRRVADLSLAIGKAMGLSAVVLEGLYLAAMIHDVGKFQVPLEILTKPSILLPEEQALIRIHPRTGYEILKDIEFPWPIADVVHQHHERVDGGGYPQGLKGDEIIIEARIVAVADTVEAMANDRPYRSAPGREKALRAVRDGVGSAFDARVAETCLELFEQHGYEFPRE